MNFEAILEKFLAWWYLNMYVGLVLIALVVFLMIATTVWHFVQKGRKALNIRKSNAISLADGMAFCSKTLYYVLCSEMVAAGFMSAEDAATEKEEKIFVRKTSVKLESLGAVENGKTVCQRDEFCTEKGVWTWRMNQQFRMPVELLHEAE